MSEFEQKLKKEAQKIRLTPGEKALMRARIFGLPAQAGARVPSPYVAYSFQLTALYRYALVALLTVFLVGGGTVSAAQGALPGDVLYPVKISVNEGVEELFARTPTARAEVHTKFAQRRLEEAETLAALGTLDATTTAKLEERLNTHVERAHAFALELEVKEPDIAAEVKVKLESSLAAHSIVLARLGQESENEMTREHSSNFSARILARAQARGESSRERAAAVEMVTVLVVSEDATSTKMSGTARERVALRFKERALDALGDAREEFEENRKVFTASTTAEVEAQLAAIQALVSVGTAALEGGSTTEAQVSFTKAFEAAVQLEALLKAEKKFNKRIVEPLRRIFNDDEDDNKGSNRSNGRGVGPFKLELGF